MLSARYALIIVLYYEKVFNWQDLSFHTFRNILNIEGTRFLVKGSKFITSDELANTKTSATNNRGVFCCHSFVL